MTGNLTDTNILESNSTKGYRAAFALMTSLFFMWGAIVSLNDVLIPHFKDVFNMNYTQAMLIQFCYFGAYFIMAVPASMVVQRIGYKNGIVVGLAIIGIGGLTFIPAASLISYPLFLFGLFVMASGSVLLQVVCNPYVIILGAPEGASSRLNLAQGVNSLGTTLAPLIGSYLILGEFESDAEAVATVRGPYIGFALFAFLVAVIFYLAKLPAIKGDEKDKDEKVEGNVLGFRQLRLGVIALTLYVGAEVTIGSFIVSFLGESYIAGLSTEDAAKYIPLYWGSLMIGRFVGSAILQKISANKVLAYAAGVATLFMVVTMFASGAVAMWAMLLAGFCNAIMWANIFAMSIKGLGKYTIKASGILVMAPVGGAILPMFQGMLADSFAGLQISFVLPMLCYAFILYYAVSGYKPGKNEPALLEE